MLNQILSNLADFRETVEVRSQFLMQPTFIHWQELSVGVMVVHSSSILTFNFYNYQIKTTTKFQRLINFLWILKNRIF